MHCTKVCKKRTRRFPSRWGSVPSHSTSLLGAFVQMVWFRESNLNDRNPRTEKPSGIPLPGNKATAFNFTAGLLYFLHWVLLLQVSQETTDFKHPQEHGYILIVLYFGTLRQKTALELGKVRRLGTYSKHALEMCQRFDWHHVGQEE